MYSLKTLKNAFATLAVSLAVGSAFAAGSPGVELFPPDAVGELDPSLAAGDRHWTGKRVQHGGHPGHVGGGVVSFAVFHVSRDVTARDDSSCTFASARSVSSMRSSHSSMRGRDSRVLTPFSSAKNASRSRISESLSVRTAPPQ